MPLVRPEKNPVSGMHFQNASVLPFQNGLTGEKHHPFVPLLIVPETGRRGLPEGDDALHENSPIRKQRLGDLFLRKVTLLDAFCQIPGKLEKVPSGKDLFP